MALVSKHIARDNFAMDAEIYQLAAQVGQYLSARGQSLVTAESCTGGWLAKAITDIPGSSKWFDRGFITYSNQAKQEQLGVSAEILDIHGAVSEAAVRAMAIGALHTSSAQMAVAISGIAGPDGGTVEKPVGGVWFAWSIQQEEPITHFERFSGGRDAVRRAAVLMALRQIIS